MAGAGYEQTKSTNLKDVRSTPNSRHSLADVRYRADFVRFTPKSRHQCGEISAATIGCRFDKPDTNGGCKGAAIVGKRGTPRFAANILE